LLQLSAATSNLLLQQDFSCDLFPPPPPSGGIGEGLSSQFTKIFALNKLLSPPPFAGI
jgi:hypothetical protein